MLGFKNKKISILLESILLICIIYSCSSENSEKKDTWESPLYGVWHNSQEYSQDDITLKDDRELTFYNDSTGSIELILTSSILSDPIYNKKNFKYSLNGTVLRIKFVGTEDNIKLSVKDLTDNSFILCGLEDIEKTDLVKELYFTKSNDDPLQRKDKNMTFDPNKIWLLTLGQPISEAKVILRRSNYNYNEDEYGLKGNQQLEFMGFNWSCVDVGKTNDDRIKRIFFRQQDYRILNDKEKDMIVKELDKLYGEHRLDNTTVPEYQFWSWQNGEYKVSFSCMDDLGSQELVFEKK